MKTSFVAPARPLHIVFDLDDTIIATEKHYLPLEVEFLKENYGIDITTEELEPRVAGKACAEKVVALRDIFEAVSAPYNPDVLEQEFRDLHHGQIPPQAGYIDGMKELLADLIQAGYQDRMYIATNSERVSFDAKIERFGLDQYFADQNMFSADDSPSQKPKPAPDLCLHIAERHGFDPQDAVMIDDSVAGTSGARAAGMFAIGTTAAHDGGHDMRSKRLTDSGVQRVVSNYLPNDAQSLRTVLEQEFGVKLRQRTGGSRDLDKDLPSYALA